MSPLSDLVLSHHHPDQHERCIVLAGRRVCRRCAVMYPLAVLVAAVALAAFAAPPTWSLPLMLLLPVPVTVEFVAEHVAGLRYDARRQIATTALAAPALGLGFARVLSNRGAAGFWLMVAAHAGPCALAWAASTARAARRERGERARTEHAHPLMTDFESAEAFRSYLDATAERLGVDLDLGVDLGATHAAVPPLA